MSQNHEDIRVICIEWAQSSFPPRGGHEMSGSPRGEFQAETEAQHQHEKGPLIDVIGMACNSETVGDREFEPFAGKVNALCRGVRNRRMEPFRSK